MEIPIPLRGFWLRAVKEEQFYLPLITAEIPTDPIYRKTTYISAFTNKARSTIHKNRKNHPQLFIYQMMTTVKVRKMKSFTVMMKANLQTQNYEGFILIFDLWKQWLRFQKPRY